MVSCHPKQTYHLPGYHCLRKNGKKKKEKHRISIFFKWQKNIMTMKMMTVQEGKNTGQWVTLDPTLTLHEDHH